MTAGRSLEPKSHCGDPRAKSTANPALDFSDQSGTTEERSASRRRTIARETARIRRGVARHGDPAHGKHRRRVHRRTNAVCGSAFQSRQRALPRESRRARSRVRRVVAVLGVPACRVAPVRGEFVEPSTRLTVGCNLIAPQIDTRQRLVYLPQRPQNPCSPRSW